MTSKTTGRPRTFPIVGIGASAGGLEALEGFFDHMDPTANLAFVVIQHLSPNRKSIMNTLLEKHTKMRVLEARDKIKVEPNSVYLNPPDKDVAIENRTLRLIEPAETHAARLPIDSFFRSLAADQGERAICVILSGTGTDGTLGLKAIKGEGGMTMVQEESQAKHGGMPRSAISTGLADYVLPVEKMAKELMKYASHSYLENKERAAPASEKKTDDLHKILELILGSTGHNFSGYKLTTIRRRVERRMAVHQIDEMDQYVRYLRQNPAEVDPLYKDLLITVTNFFRDPPAFDALRDKAIVPLLKDKPSGSSLRIWVPGCATGEEAFSIAMLVMETMETLKQRLNVQIFATDIDEEAINYARLAIFPDSIAADVDEERLERFFTKEDGKYKLKKHVRETVVFAVQSLIKDPPYTRLDLVSCRNVLIYMDSALQKKIVPLFHYTLKPEGVLYLGPSEAIGQFTELFSAIDTKWKIFARKGAVSETSKEVLRMPTQGKPTRPQTNGSPPLPERTNVRHVVEKLILDDYAPPCVLVNEKFDIVYFHGRTDSYLRPPTGEPHFNILKMAREELGYELSLALNKAFKQKKAVQVEELFIRDKGEAKSIRLVVRPLVEQGLTDTMMVVFGENTPGPAHFDKKKKAPAGGKIDSRVAALEQDLRATKHYLQTTIENLEVTNEELKSTNEELQSTNEELQSTNEELETSKEELNSTNEELETVNAELQHRVVELSDVNNDLNNLLASSEIATIFLDTNLHIRRFTPESAELFNVIPTDVGRPLTDIRSNLVGVELCEEAEEVLKTLVPKQAEVSGAAGMWYTVRILPYRTTDNVIDGVVITFSDVTRLKMAEQEAQNAMAYSQNIIDTVPDPFVVLNAKLQVVSANKSFYRTFHTTVEESQHQLIYDLGNRQWDIPQLRTVLEEIIPKNSRLEEFEVDHEFPFIGRKRFLLNARRIEQTGEKSDVILLAFKEANHSTSSIRV